jgi:hypothetical protein
VAQCTSRHNYDGSFPCYRLSGFALDVVNGDGLFGYLVMGQTIATNEIVLRISMFLDKGKGRDDGTFGLINLVSTDFATKNYVDLVKAAFSQMQ